jgi:hypothetical protein
MTRPPSFTALPATLCPPPRTARRVEFNGTVRGALLGLLEVEHDVFRQQLFQLGIEFCHGQQQQPDGLLQLRRHRQLLAESEL